MEIAGLPQEAALRRRGFRVAAGASIAVAAIAAAAAGFVLGRSSTAGSELAPLPTLQQAPPVRAIPIGELELSGTLPRLRTAPAPVAVVRSSAPVYRPAPPAAPTPRTETFGIVKR